MEDWAKTHKDNHIEEKLSSNSIYINTLIYLAEEICNKRADPAELTELCKILRKLYKKLSLLFENLTTLQNNQIIKENLEEFHVVLMEINKYSDNRDNIALWKNIKYIINITENLFNSFNRLKEKEKNIIPPSKSPLLNELIITAGEVIDGKLSINALKEKINFLKEFTESTKKQIYSLLNDPDTVTLLEESQKIRTNLYLYQEGLQEIDLYFQDGEKSHIEKGIDITKKATEELFSSLDILYEAADIVTKVICLRCGHKNSLHGDFCSLCHRVLPKAAPANSQKKETKMYEIKDFEYVITDNFNTLLEGVRQVEKKEISWEKFILILDSMEEKLQEVTYNFNLIEQKGLRVNEVFFFFMDSLGKIDYGIKTIKLYCKDKNSDHLDKGLNIIFEASKTLCDIQSVAVEAERELKRDSSAYNFKNWE